MVSYLINTIKNVLIVQHVKLSIYIKRMASVKWDVLKNWDKYIFNEQKQKINEEF